ncbi:MAG: hypothetical protein HQ567_22800 [Candidatus Nealsonbacteria bacterium]|nr:hypothetical protein [Candidatus Nealsonbacteria bacterium]
MIVGEADTRCQFPRIDVVFVLLAVLAFTSHCLADVTLDEALAKLASYNGPSVEGVDRSTLTGMVMCGYQGWFTAEGDGAPHAWFHYDRRGGFRPGQCSIDLWPDLRELDDDEKYPTPFRHADGRVAHVFSSLNRKTVVRHFQWMQQHGIDGAFVQRFTPRPDAAAYFDQITTVLAHCREGANRHGRAYAVMYDMHFDARAIDNMKQDWRRLVDGLKITDDKAYLRHKGRPVIALWGAAFTHRGWDAAAAKGLLDFLKNDPKYGGMTVMLGVPAYWRELHSDCRNDKAVHELLLKADVISPWNVGRFGRLDDVAHHAEVRMKPDVAWCRERDKDYLPVVFPGFSWHNMQPDKPLDQIPRHKGQFLWRQYVEAKRAGATMIYQAMFDEIDEGTAIFKCTNEPPVGESPFLTYEGLPSDHYLWLAGTGGRLIRGEIEPTRRVPLRDGRDFFPPIRINPGKSDSPLAKLAVDELCTFLGQLFINPPLRCDAVNDLRVVLGTPQSSALVRQAVEQGKVELPTGDDADQGYAIKTIDGVIYVAATTDRGVLNGVYELLEAYGVYFQISGERMSDRREFVVKSLDVARVPAVKHRGLCLRDGLLLGKSDDDVKHVRELIDRATRMKLNMFQTFDKADVLPDVLPDEQQKRWQMVLDHARSRGMTISTEPRADQELPDESPERWFPRFQCSRQEQTYRDEAESGVERLMLPCRNVSGMEHHVRYLAEFTWDPQRTADKFYTEYVRRLYGEAAVPAVADLYRQYDASQNEPDAPPTLPDVPTTAEGLDVEVWVAAVKRATEATGRQQLLDSDRRAIATFGAVTGKLPGEGRRWANVMTGRLKVRCLYLESMMALNRSLITFDKTARQQNIEAAGKAAAEHACLSLDLARRAIDKYTVRTRSDRDAVAELEVQVHDAIGRFLGELEGQPTP